MIFFSRRHRWTPRQLGSRLLLWFAADWPRRRFTDLAQTSLAMSTGDSVASMRGIVGGSISQSVPADRPNLTTALGRAAVSFGATDSSLENSFSLPSEWDAFLAFRVASFTPADSRILRVKDLVGVGSHISPPHNAAVVHDLVAWGTTSSTSCVSPDGQVLRLSRRTAITRLFWGADLTGTPISTNSAGTSADSNLRIFSLNGNLVFFELIVTSVVSASAARSVGRYLRTRWRIPA